MSGSASLTEEIYGQIRQDLIAGRFRPGERLKAKDLSVGLDVSLGVVREALSRLTAEGFVQAQPQRGFRAGPVSAKELMQLAEATINVEGFCLRRSIEIGDLDWETGVTAAYYRFANTPLRDAADPSRICNKFSEAYAEFRRALVSACDNQWMLKMQEMLHSQNERYRQICMLQGAKVADYRDKYPVLVEAVLRRDADRAVALLSERLQSNALRMRDLLTQSNVLGADAPPAAPRKAKKHPPRVASSSA
jgi:DNA-binding GntR family transcriptional regulator